MPKTTVKLISAEGFEFIVDYKAACVSNTIRNMLSSSGEARCERLGPGGARDQPRSRRALDARRCIHGNRAGRGQVPGDIGADPGEGLPVLLLQAAVPELVSPPRAAPLMRRHPQQRPAPRLTAAPAPA